nr:hypothetical protein [uncultured Albidiferax sp.]
MTKRKKPTRTTASFLPLTTAQHAVIAAAAPQKRGQPITSIIPDVDSSVWNTCAAISDTKKAPIFSREAALQPLEQVRVDGDSHVLTELLQTARELHKSGQMSDAELSYLVLLANTKPMNEAALMAKIEERYPRRDQSVSLEDILSPERIVAIRALR